MCSKVTDFVRPSTSSLRSTKVAAAKLKLCAFVVEHNLPVAILDHLPGLVANVCEDSSINGEIKCGRTKGTGVFRAVLVNIARQLQVSIVTTSYLLDSDTLYQWLMVFIIAPNFLEATQTIPCGDTNVKSPAEDLTRRSVGNEQRKDM
ncbi:hypothetical protein FHG87_017293, partial [Trinorchestia longiramus]